MVRRRDCNHDSADDVRNAPLSGVHVVMGRSTSRAPSQATCSSSTFSRPTPATKKTQAPSRYGLGVYGRFATKNGGGFLTERFPDAYKVIWDFKGDVATSRHIPEVSYVGIHHPGPMGTAPSAELLAKWTKRETDLIATDPHRVPPLALPPLPDSAILGSLKGADFDRVAREAARTAPPREYGGNQDIKNLTAGSRVFYPVFVPGAKLSFGDLHFSQGDGEITFCGAIGWAGSWTARRLIKGGMAAYGIGENAIFMPGLPIRSLRVDCLLRGLGRPRRQAALSGLAVVLRTRLPSRYRLPYEIRLLGHSGLHDPGFSAGRGTVLRCGGHPELVRHDLYSESDLRLRRPPI